MEGSSLGEAHTALFITEIVQGIYRNVGLWDLECGLRVCKAWRSALSSSVSWLTLPAGVGSYGIAPQPDVDGDPPRASQPAALALFSNARCLTLAISMPRVDQSEQPDLADQTAQLLPLFQQHLTRAVSLEVLQPHRISKLLWDPRGAGRQQSGPDQDQRQGDLVAVIATVCHGAGGPLVSAERLTVRGPLPRVIPMVAQPSLADLLPSLTHLDLAPEPQPQPAEDCEAAGPGCDDEAGSEGAGYRGRSGLLGPFYGTYSSRCDQNAAPGRLPAAGRSALVGECHSLALRDAQPLFRSLPLHLRHLSARLDVQDCDRISAWAAALADLPPGLTSLRLLGPLCHSTELAAAVAAWSDQLPRLEALALELGECCHSHPDLEGQLYDDPGMWTSSCWQGVFPALTQLRSLELLTDSVQEALWADLRRCTQMTRLRLHPSGWSGMFASAGLSHLRGLRDLALSLYDNSELRELSALAELQRLELQLQDLADHEARTCPGGILGRVTAGQAQLRHLRLSCHAGCVEASHLGVLAAACPRLQLLELHATFREARAATSTRTEPACSLPPQLRVLHLRNTCATADLPRGCDGVLPTVRFAALPDRLVRLSLRGLTLDLEPHHTHGDSDPGTHGVGTCVPVAARPVVALQVVELEKCVVAVTTLATLLGSALRALSLVVCTVPTPEDAATEVAGSTGPLQALQRCQELRHLRIWGCRGALRPLHDGALGELVRAQSQLRVLAINATAATAGGLASLAQLGKLRFLQIAVVGHEWAAGLGDALASLRGLQEVEIVLQTGGFVFLESCVPDHLARRLPDVQVRLRSQQHGF